MSETSELNPNRYRFVVFSSEENKGLLTLVSNVPFGSVSVGDSINVQDMRPDDSRESICQSSGHFAKITSVEHRIIQCPFGEIEHTIKITVDSSNQNFK
ncbi:hypothetical protein FCH33_02035 [Serratia fonticola]|uniref:hypothetical protein n=1 Tax=Serratia fonticola TaxID=47917 RepID=UPI0015771141|nr:hypothetical protein [Serratia fonticola]NTY85556.1 hypothetical protein [Serratia fonticola]NTZ11601.1 hypothetical protein [Serratia fonticola]